MKLTERDILTSQITGNDLFHMVDVSDTKQSPDGSSFKAPFSTILTKVVNSHGYWGSLNAGNVAYYDISTELLSVKMLVNYKISIRSLLASTANFVLYKNGVLQTNTLFLLRRVDGDFETTEELSFVIDNPDPADSYVIQIQRDGVVTPWYLANKILTLTPIL